MRHDPGFRSATTKAEAFGGDAAARPSSPVIPVPLIVAALALITGCGDKESDQPDDAAREPAASETAAPASRSGQASPEGPEGEDAEGFWLGEPRDDTRRFLGVYGDPEIPGHSFFVAEARRPAEAERAPEIPPGYLMIGAMWGDVAPWTFRSVGPLRFEQAVRGPSGPPEPIVVTFEAEGDDQATALTFETVFDARGRLERLKDLPEGW